MRHMSIVPVIDLLVVVVEATGRYHRALHQSLRRRRSLPWSRLRARRSPRPRARWQLPDPLDAAGMISIPEETEPRGEEQLLRHRPAAGHARSWPQDKAACQPGIASASEAVR